MQKLYATRAERRDSGERATVTKRIRGTRPSIALEKYAGSYVDSLVGKLVVTAERGKLRVRASSMLSGTAEHWQYDTFRITWDKIAAGTDFITFTIGEAGVPAQLQFMGYALRRDGP